MEVIYLNSTSNIQKLNEHVMAIGFFDGVHLGHQQLFNKAKMIANKKGLKSSALTFSPHPDEIIKGDKDRKYLTPLHEKINKIKKCGLDTLFIMNFDKNFASLSPVDFIKRYIVNMRAKHVVVGFDFTFGFKAQGNTTLLENECIKRDFGLTVVPKMTYLQSKIGSTKTKALIHEGNVATVPFYLGTHYQINAQISKMSYTGLYTVQTNEQYILPQFGTYEVSVSIENKVYAGELTINEYVDKELLIYDYENVNDQALEITFLNRLAVSSAIFA